MQPSHNDFYFFKSENVLTVAYTYTVLKLACIDHH